MTQVENFRKRKEREFIFTDTVQYNIAVPTIGALIRSCWVPVTSTWWPMLPSYCLHLMACT